MPRFVLLIPVVIILVLMFAFNLGISSASHPERQGDDFSGEGIVWAPRGSHTHLSNSGVVDGRGALIGGCGENQYPLCPWQYLDPAPKPRIKSD